MDLFERGNISPNVVESRISKLAIKKADINRILEGDRQVLTVIEHAESQLTSQAIGDYVDRFEEY